MHALLLAAATTAKSPQLSSYFQNILNAPTTANGVPIGGLLRIADDIASLIKIGTLIVAGVAILIAILKGAHAAISPTDPNSRTDRLSSAKRTLFIGVGVLLVSMLIVPAIQTFLLPSVFG